MRLDIYINNAKKEELNGKILFWEIADNEGLNLDSLSLVIDNALQEFAIPKNKGTIELAVNNVLMGVFNIQYIEANSGIIQIQALSQDLEKSKIKYNRVFKNKSLKDVLHTLSTSLGLDLSVDVSLGIKNIPFLLQDEKTDLEMLEQLATIYYAIANVKDNTLVFMPKDKIQVPITITEADIISIHSTESDNKNYSGVFWSGWDFKSGAKVELKLGVAPYFYIKENLDKELIKNLVISKNKEIKEVDFIDLEAGGNPEIQAGFELNLVNLSLNEDFKGRYRICSVRHVFDNGFYTSHVNAVLKN